MDYQLAQVNVARLVAGAEDPRTAGLFLCVDEMNRIAEITDGFIWRLRGSQMAAEALLDVAAYLGGIEFERVFYNLSVWKSPDHLRQYVYQTRHKEMVTGKHSWVEAQDRPPGRASLALWWIPADHKPSMEESLKKLEALSRNGPTEVAFTLSRTFPPPTVT